MPAFLSLIRAAVVPALALAIFAAQAASVILDTPQVVQAIGRDAIVWDVRPAAAYRQAHIPGAVNIGDVTLLNNFLNHDQIAALRDQLAASKAELAKATAELDRIKKRLANPSN